jgi:thiol-disulfide isomerase/thioredoxin
MVSSSIVNVDKENISKLKDNINHNGAVILYYWNSCGHCHRLMPIWNELLDKYNNRQFYQIELDYMQQAPNEFRRITSFPHITAYYNGNKVIYDGDRNINSLSSFIEKYLPVLKKSSKSPSKSASKLPSKSPSKQSSKLAKKHKSVKSLI